MTHNDIIKLAREAHHKLVTQDYPGHLGQLDPWTIRLLERFTTLVAQHERECCALLCESMDEPNLQLRYEYRRGALNCADAIRARNKRD